MIRLAKIATFFGQVMVVSLFIYLMVLWFPTDSFFEKDVATIYSIDINPGIVMMADEDEVVLHLEGINVESQELIDDIRYRRQTVDYVFEEIIDRAIEHGYINNQQKNYVLLSRITVADAVAPLEYELVDLVYEKIWEAVDGHAEVYFYEGREEIYIDARSQGITPGIALFLEDLKSQYILVDLPDHTRDESVLADPKVIEFLASLDGNKSSYISQPITKEGVITITATSTSSENDNPGRNLGYNLKTADNDYFILDVSRVDFAKLNRITANTDVEVVGRFDYNAETVIVENINVISENPVTAASASLDVFSKNRRVAVVMVNFSDSNFALSRSQINGIMFANSQNVNSWHRTMSYGQVSFSGDIFGPITIPYSRSSNWDANKFRIADYINSQYNLSGYHHLLMLTASHNQFSGGMAVVGCISTPCPAWVEIRQINAEWLRVITHELGHNLGLYHSATPGNEYGDTSCIMGRVTLPLLNAPNMYNLGYFDSYSGAVNTITRSGTYTLSATSLNPSSTSNPQMLKIPNSSGYYSVSYRKNAGKDSGIASQFTNGVSIHSAQNKRGFLSQHLTNTVLLRTLTNGTSWSGSGGISVRQVSRTTDNVTVEVTMPGSPQVTERTLSVNSSGASSVSISGSPTTYSGTTSYRRTGIADGTSVRLTAPATSGNTTFTGWTGTGCTSSSREIMINMNRDITCTANYRTETVTPSTYNLTVTSSVVSNVNIVASPSTYGGSTNYTKFNITSGTRVTLTAPATSGNASFTGWSGTGCTSSNRTVVVTMNSNRTCTAQYGTINTWSLSVSSTGASNVSITASPSNYGGTTSYTRSNISHGTSITLRAPMTVGSYSFDEWTGLGCTSRSNSITVSMTSNRNCVARYSQSSSPTPEKPVLNCSTAGTNRINLSWSRVSGASLYYVWYCEGSSCIPRERVGTTSSTSYAVSNLKPGTTYRFRVYGNDGQNIDSNYVTCTTDSASTPPPQKYATPTGLHCSSDQYSVTLNWNSVPEATIYWIYSCTGSSCIPQINGSATMATTTSRRITGLSPGTTYRYRIVASGLHYQMSDPSAILTCTTNSTTPPPEPTPTKYQTPTGLSCSTTTSSVTLNWNRVPEATVYWVYSCRGGHCTPTIGSSANYAGTNSFTHRNLLANTTYNYRVVASGVQYQMSDPSRTVSCTTGSTAPPPSPGDDQASGTLSFVSSTRMSITFRYSFSNVAGSVSIRAVGYPYTTTPVASGSGSGTATLGHVGFELNSGTTYRLELYDRTTNRVLAFIHASTQP